MRAMGRSWRMLSVLTLLLTACGNPDQATTGSQPTTTTSLAAYPAPATNTPQAFMPTQAAPTATRPAPSPTKQVTVSPNLDAPTSFSLFKTLTLDPGAGPHYLADWSSNGKYLLYTQLGEKPDSAEVYLLDVETGKQRLLTDESFAGLQGKTGFYLDIAPPQWMDDGTQILISKPKPNDQQELVLIDREGKEQKKLGLYKRGPVFRQSTGELVIAQKGAMVRSTKAEQPIVVPELDNQQALAIIKVNSKNKAASLPDPENLHIFDVIDPTKTKNINVRNLVKDKVSEADRVEIDGITWSPNGEKLAFWVHYGLYDDIWTTDADGNNPQQVISYDTIRGGHLTWSPDNTMIAITIAPTGTESWKYISLSILYLADLHVQPVADRISGNPLWDKTGRLLAIAQYDEQYSVNAIALYRSN